MSEKPEELYEYLSESVREKQYEFESRMAFMETLKQSLNDYNAEIVYADNKIVKIKDLFYWPGLAYTVYDNLKCLNQRELIYSIRKPTKN